MRKSIIYLLLFSSNVYFAQTTYQDGFNAGYSSGYCYGEAACLSPLPPLAGLAPINPVGQSDYQTGYNYGFSEGQRSKSNTTVSTTNGGAYGQLKRTEPDRSQQYISAGVNRLMQEQKDRATNQRSSKSNEEDIKSDYVSKITEIADRIDKTYAAFKMAKYYLDSKNISVDIQKKAIEKFSDSLNQIITYYNDNRNSFDQVKFDLINNKLNTLNEEWNFSLNYGEVKNLLTESK